MNAISPSPICTDLADEEATSQLGADIAMASGSGMIFLSGDLGSGKSTFARALIRHLAGDDELEVPSPTFSMVQHYEVADASGVDEIVHADLYRLKDPLELEELGLTSPERRTLRLVEWPENAIDSLGECDLYIRFVTIPGTLGRESRRATIQGSDSWLRRVRRSLLIRAFLEREWGHGVFRQPLIGDASSRSYETVTLDDTRILMNAPRQPDGPPIRDGKPYSHIAHLAEDISAFIGVDHILAQAGLKVPALYQQDMENGLLVLEHLGSGKIIDDARRPIMCRYEASVDTLSRFHRSSEVTDVSFKFDDGSHHVIPPYDRDAMKIEAELLLDWYAPRFKGAPLSEKERSDFIAIWDELINHLVSSEKRIVLRDFHSPNIIWLGQEGDGEDIAVIDFQDAVIGPSAYDLASLAQDARVDISREMEEGLVRRYCVSRRVDPGFNEDHFLQDYAIMCALRTTKILGIFVRLDERDQKPAYLAHLPRIQDYIRRCMAHPILSNYRAWYESVVDLS